jgi:DNA-binding NtrC family response regulator
MNLKLSQMKNGGLNLFIVADHALVVNGLKHYLEDRFGPDLHIYRFYDSKSCLKKINKDTQAVVLDSVLEGRRGDEILKSIQTINPNTEGIIYSSTEEVAAYVDALLKGEHKVLNNLRKYNFHAGLAENQLIN